MSVSQTSKQASLMVSISCRMTESFFSCSLLFQRDFWATILSETHHQKPRLLQILETRQHGGQRVSEQLLDFDLKKATGKTRRRSEPQNGQSVECIVPHEFPRSGLHEVPEILESDGHFVPFCLRLFRSESTRKNVPFGP